VTAYNKIPYITSIQIGNSYPPSIPELNGPNVGRINKEYEFTAKSNDPEGDQIYYIFDWGDGTKSEWIGPFESGTEVKLTHTWAEIGNYSVKAKAKDVEGSSSRWTAPHVIIIDVPKIRIRLIQGGLFKIKIIVSNEGIAEADDIDWEINLNGGSIFLGRNSKNTIDTIAPGDEVTITSKAIIGFGKINAQITLNGPECYYYRERSGNVFLFYVKINPGGG
jgi:hypothetical protein